jgi:hypothetical protein
MAFFGRAAVPRWVRSSSGPHSRGAEVAGRIGQDVFGPLIESHLPPGLCLPPAPEPFFPDSRNHEMFSVRIGPATLAEPKMIACQHRARVSRVFRARVRAPAGIALFGLKPTNQIPHGAANSLGPRGGIQRNQVQTADTGFSRPGLRLYLDQLILAGQADGAGGDRVLGGGGDSGSTPLGDGRGSAA